MRATALVALVVVHSAVGHVLSMHVTVVQVVDVVPMHERVVSTAGAVGVAVHFRRNVLNSRHHTQPLVALDIYMLICADLHVKSRRAESSVQVTDAVSLPALPCTTFDAHGLSTVAGRPGVTSGGPRLADHHATTLRRRGFTERTHVHANNLGPTGSHYLRAYHR